jgi:hypothetical protein
MRRRVSVLLLAIAAACLAAPSASAAFVSVSLNLVFSTPNDFNSGGTWRMVAKADDRGISAMSVNLFNINAAGVSFLAPQFETQQLTFVDDVDDFYAFDAADSPAAKTLDLGVMGGSVPSSYVDAPGTSIYPGYPDLGSFTGGIELASGSFSPGVVPYWVNGPTIGSNGAFVYESPDGNGVSGVTTQRTIRYVIPEPATLGLAGVALIGLIAASRRSTN